MSRHQSENAYLGNILRYLKQGIPSQGIPARYPNLKQVFLTSRIYGGYAKNPPAPPVGPGGDDGCVSPEPFAYETAFAIQRIINAQINQDNGGQVGADPYSGAVTDQGSNPSAPWVDWGPYLWADGTTHNAEDLFYCDHGNTAPGCDPDKGDVRYGDPTMGYENFWGDHVHPTASSQARVSNVLKQFFLGTLPGPQSYIVNWVTPWAKP